jgi:poly-gamma-glutamate synthesis protein (capsule biosynthesis protein)
LDAPIDPTTLVAHTPTQAPETTLLFTGVIVPARCVQAALDAHGDPDYPYEEVRPVIQDADLAVGVLNATMSDFPPHTGCVPTYVLVGSPQNADALARAGFDVMSVATNHIKDCGITTCDHRAFFDTLDNLQRVDIQAVGAGKDEADAMRPLVVTANGIRFAFVALGDSRQGEWTFAGPEHPGIARLTEQNMVNAIQAARQVADVVIALPHWGPEDVSVPNGIQRLQAQYTVAAGVDLVVGNHTHVVQAIQEIDGVPVFYGLGNFVFDQGLATHRQGVMLLVHFKGEAYTGYELIPTHVDPDGRVHIAGEQEAAEIIQRIEEASRAVR